MYLFSNFFDELVTTVDQNVQSVASYVVNNIIGNITYQDFTFSEKKKKTAANLCGHVIEYLSLSECKMIRFSIL